MDLLETILRTANAEKYIEQFRDEDINAQSLKLLNDEDLKLIGVDDADIRMKILKETQNLIIASEQKTKINIDPEYANSVLIQMPNILKLHYSNLYSALSRKSILNCEMQLEPAMASLLNSLGSLKKEIKAIKGEVDKKNRKKKRITAKNIFVSTTVLGVFLYTNYILIKKLCL